MGPATKSMTTEVPMSFRRRGGKAVIVLPDGTRAARQQEATVDNTMIKVIARAFRWQRLLNEGAYTSMDALATAEKISPSYISRILRLAYLAPDIIVAIVEGRHPAHLTMKSLMEPFPLEWGRQVDHFLRSGLFGLGSSPGESQATIKTMKNSKLQYCRPVGDDADHGGTGISQPRMGD